MAAIETPVTHFLNAEKIPYRVYRHSGPIRSLEQAAQERGQLPEQIIRSIVFRWQKDQYLMVLMPGTKRVSWSTLRKFLGQSRITMASEQDILEVTGYRLGAVSPIGLPSPMRILVDESVLEQPEISIGSGERGLAVIMKSGELLSAIGKYELGNFSN